jgi:hypothetical protein
MTSHTHTCGLRQIKKPIKKFYDLKKYFLTQNHSILNTDTILDFYGPAYIVAFSFLQIFSVFLLTSILLTQGN